MNQCTIEGVIHDVKLKRPKPRLTLVEIGVTDSTGVVIVTAFRQPWLAEQLSAGMRVAIAGKIEFNYGFKRMVNPQILPLEGSDAPAHGLVIPVHPAGEKVTPALMRRFVSNALELAEGVLDPMPLELRVKYRLVSRQVAFHAIHFPESLAEAHEARRRLAYEEVLLLELHLMQQGAAAPAVAMCPRRTRSRARACRRSMQRSRSRLPTSSSRPDSTSSARWRSRMR